MLMKKNKQSTYSLAKNISYEILIEEKLKLKSEAVNRLFVKYSKKRRALKLKFISYKIINAIVFGVLPIFPLMAYLDISRFLINVPVHVQVAILIKSLTFEIFFTLQFLNFFLMGIFSLINILSGEIFEWFKTLPLSRKKLKKLSFFTIFHNFDLPILANIFIFPIVMYFATQNIIVFFISLGTSFLNITFSISVLIILGEKVAKLIKKQNLKAKKSLLVQLLNTFSYVIIIFGSILIIQMILSSLATIFIASVNLYRSPLYNAILSLIPFPFNPSYLISFFTSTSHIPVPYWLNPLFGLGLYLIVIYVLFRKAMKSLNNVISLKYKFNKNDLSVKKDELRIHISSKVKAFIRKDLIIASRNIQTFMSFTMPIMMSFIFMIFLNISFTGSRDLLSGDLYYIWIVLLAFNPILSGMIVYNILNIDTSGKTIMGALPIVSRDRTKGKLVIMIVIQIIVTLTPPLVYIFHYRFVELFLTVLATLPFVLIFLISIFLLRVRLFGKKRYFCVLDEILPENKVSKWTLIFTIEYLLYYLIILISNFLYFNFDFLVLFVTLLIISVIISVILKRIFDKFFPKFKIHKGLKDEKPMVKKEDSKFINRLLFITFIRIIYFFVFFTFILVYGFFLGGLFTLTGFILILEVIISPLKKKKKNFHQINSKIKTLFTKKVDVVRYILHSFLKHVLVLFGVLLLNFILVRSFLSSEINVYLSARADVESYWRLVELGLHLPLWQQFFLYLGRLFTGNWGYIIRYRWASDFYSLGSPVKELILERISKYFIILIIPISIILFFNIRSSFKESNKKTYRKLIRIILLLFFSIPSFLLVLFIHSLSNEITYEVFTQLIIATLILSISMLSKLAFIKRRDITYNYDPSSYAIKKSFFSSSSFIFSSILISEVILVETVLSLQGLGDLFLYAIVERHIFLIEAILFIFTLTIISISFIQSLLKLYFQIKIIKNTEINELMNKKIKKQIKVITV